MGKPRVGNRRICVVTTSRADYGLLYWTLRAIEEDPDLTLQLVVTGMHLSPAFGLTARLIEADGFGIDRRVEMLLSSDSEGAVAKAMGLALISFGEVLQELSPDIVVLLGDRFEIVPVALAAVVCRTPVAHIHGGETSEGAIDEAFRHAVTKLSSLHFAAAEPYRQRIVQMGEDPSRTFTVGAPGLDQIYRVPLMDRAELAGDLGFSLEGPVALVTFHPATAERGTALEQVDRLLASLESAGIRGICTKANADAEGSVINGRVEEFCRRHPERFRLFDSLGQQRYLSCLKNVEVMLGNSSSGLIEAPSFELPVVNVGERQRGRIRGRNVIDAACSVEGVVDALQRALSPEFRESLRGMENPYDPFRDGRSSQRIKEVLKTVELSEALIKKTFHDLPCRGAL